MSKILVSGSLAYDHIMDFPGLFKDSFMPDKLHNINVSFNIADHAEHFGGCAGNVAFSLAMLGEKPAIIGTVGNDFDRYAKHLQEAGIDTSSIHIDQDAVTSFAYVMTDKADNQIAAFHPGAGAIAYGEPAMEKDTLAIIGPGCLADMRAFPDVFRGNGVRFLFDPGQSINALSADDLRNGITNAEVVFTNDYEFALISSKTGWSEKDAVNEAKTLIITLGAEGTRIITKDGEEKVAAAPSDKVLDPTGAGDAYRAGYIKGMIAGLPSTVCAKLGSVVAAFAIESVGTQEHTFTLEDVKTRYQKSYNETLAL
jgi:adenosine kinase